MEFDLSGFEELEPKHVDFPIGGKPYRLKEATGAAAVEWRNASIKAAKMRNGKVIGMEGLADTEPLLISKCLFQLVEKDGKTKEVPVTRHTIMSWPARIQKRLFDMVTEMSDLKEETTEALQRRIVRDQKKLAQLNQRVEMGEDEEQAKNEHSATTDTSV
jgi:hypothetical protein